MYLSTYYPIFIGDASERVRMPFHGDLEIRFYYLMSQMSSTIFDNIFTKICHFNSVCVVVGGGERGVGGEGQKQNF